MSAPQRILRVRRQYNQWVANQTLEDYALRFTALAARRWSHARVANTAIASISFLALEAIGGLATLNFGFVNAVAAIIIVSVLIFVTSIAIGYAAAREGLDIDLLTRGAGFGYLGSTISSVIYAIFTFIFFAIETAIMAAGLRLATGLPVAIGYAVSALAIIPLVIYGISFISRFQLWTQPLWVALQIAPFLAIAYYAPQAYPHWAGFAGLSPEGGAFHFALFGAAASIVFSLMGQIGEQVDFLRFMPTRKPGGFDWKWWSAMILGGPFWIVVGGLKMLAGSLLTAVALAHGMAASDATEPVNMYLTGFSYLLHSHSAVVTVTVIFVVLSQVKINVTNAYAGSIAWSNFFARLTHSHPGRVVWLVFNVMLALVLAELAVYRSLGTILSIYSNLAVAWIGALVADLVINKPLGLSPRGIEFKRAYRRDINPVGFGAMTIGAVLALVMFSGVWGRDAAAASGFAGLAAAFVSAPLLAWGTGGRHYLARTPGLDLPPDARLVCNICCYPYDRADMAFCPAYDGPICSLCCTIDARCQDRCKKSPQTAGTAPDAQAAPLPGTPPQARLGLRLQRYAMISAWLILLVAGVLAFVYMQAIAQYPTERAAIRTVIWYVFWLLAIIAAISAWMIVLARDGRIFALEESERQTALLMEEIEAHERTDAALQQSNTELLAAKDVAERANIAKSRYLIGISHELRSPLNAVMGYAQILDGDPTIPKRRHHAIRIIRRSSEHILNLIEGLFDISKIESGRLYLARDQLDLPEMMEQMADMFRLEATTKGLDFRLRIIGKLPRAVYGDAKRIRQILINLLSNAIKFTQHGSVELRIRYRDMFAEIEVRDTGSGIHSDDLERVFEPFERGRLAEGKSISGTGLGLTITRLLVLVMGGELSVESRSEEGSIFRVRLLLSEVTYISAQPATYGQIAGYRGAVRQILVVDDDPAHCEMMGEILQPRGFEVRSVGSGIDCLALIQSGYVPDLIVLDISMPGLSGWETAKTLRESGASSARIMMISGNVYEFEALKADLLFHDGAMTKPIDASQLLREIGRLLELEWHALPATHEIVAAAEDPPARDAAEGRVPSLSELSDLRRLGEIGYVRGIKDKLADLAAQSADYQWLSELLEPMVANLDFPRFTETVSRLLENSSSDAEPPYSPDC